MALKLQKAQGARNFHGYVPHFYGQYRDGKAIRTCALKTRLRGVPPESGLLTDPGDAAFEAAKALAEQELASIIERAKDKNTAIAAGCSLLTQATGQTVADLKLSNLAAWFRARERIPETDANRGWLDWHDKIIKDFADWAKAHKCGTVFEVTRELAQEYCGTLAADFTRGTLKKKVYRLAAAFRAYLPNTMKNPFEGAYKIAVANMEKDGGQEVSRKPLDAEQIRALWETARREGSMWYDLAVCAACTGLRIGDVCNLTWGAINLAENYAEVPTAKTGATVMIPLMDYERNAESYHPIFGEFRRVLDAANTDTAGTGATYVFPEAHMRYTANPSVISAKGKILFARALFGNEPRVEVVPERPPLTVDEIKAAIDAAPWTADKRTRIAKLYALYASGKTYREIEQETNYPRNRISMDFAEIERVTGSRIRPQAGTTTARALLDKTREQRTVGARAASVYGWHSLRHAWVVLALDEGWPKEDVQAVVGHTTFEMTMRYYNPTDKQRVARLRKINQRNQQAKRQRAALADPGAGAVVPANALAGLTDDQRAAVAALLKSFAMTNGNGGAQ